jgi:Ca2+/Na+ antiporter
LLKGEKEVSDAPEINTPWTHFLILIVAGVGIYFGANYTISSLTDISVILGIPSEIIALTVLSIGTTLPEIAVNVQAVRKGKVEMAVGSILGSCVFNITVIPAVSSFFGDITVPTTLLSFSIPVFVGAVKIQLAASAHLYGREILCTLIGINDLPSFINRNLAEVSLLNKIDELFARNPELYQQTILEWDEETIKLVHEFLITIQ